jgi:hypothetical protein
MREVVPGVEKRALRGDLESAVSEAIGKHDVDVDVQEALSLFRVARGEPRGWYG